MNKMRLVKFLVFNFEIYVRRVRKPNYQIGMA